MESSEFIKFGALGLSSIAGIGTEIAASIVYAVTINVVREVVSVIFIWFGIALLAATSIGAIIYYGSWNHKKIKD